MRQAFAESIYTLYDKFINEFLIQSNSILTSHENILSEKSINECIQFFINNFDEGIENFDEKVSKQFSNADIETKLVFAHAEWLWAYSVEDISVEKKRHYTLRTTNLSNEELIQEVYPKGFGNAGQWHTNNKYYEISFNLVLIKFIVEKIKRNEISTLEETKSWIEKICLYDKYECEFEGFELPQDFKEKIPEKKLAITNILTYCGNPDKYERIASDGHKKQIYQSFKNLLSNDVNESEGLNLDEKLFEIRKVLTEINQTQFDFYDNKLKKIWNYSLSDEGFDEVQGLLYKKAIILYGPPGTSKTFTAKKLAEALITHNFLKDKNNIIKYFKNDLDIFNTQIHHLQLHPNYTYEDFIAGYQLKNNESVKLKGMLFDICEKANIDKGPSPVEDKPHILILDEINRIDLSKLFGEVFSAIENREQPIKLGIGDFELAIPRNLFIIGTMNEIDFSLEQIDFALQRRFLWYFKGFDSDILRDIIEYKKAKLKSEEIEKFINNAISLNKEISSIPELGKQYQIGHAFFGEIVEIFNSYKEISGYKSISKNQLYRNNGPATILWKISIEPILKSFLGNMEPDESNKILNDLKIIYFRK